MTITVITGTPGAGKTLHSIEKLLLPLVGTKVSQEVDGVMVDYPRVIYTNIKGLLVDHQLIDGGDNQGLRDWHKWAKPGAVICFDEVQKIWQPRANGSKVPDDIQALETHRHMGVDFILITQNVMLVDRNIQALTARHLHVRRMANLALAIVYEWDHCSRALMYSKALTKSPWRYDKKIFKLYHSADLHTKQPRSMPGLVWIILVALLALVYFAPTLYGRLHERFNPLPPSAKVGRAPAVQGSGFVPGQALLAAPASVPVSVSPAPPAPAVVLPEPVLSGCARHREICRCYDKDAQPIAKPLDFCVAHTAPALILSSVEQFMQSVPDAHPAEVSIADLSMIAWATRQRHPVPGVLVVQRELKSLSQIQ